MLNLTPQCFVEVVVLGLYWEHWPPKIIKTARGHRFHTGWTTVDHVLKVLLNLKAVTSAQISMVQHKRNGQLHQRALFRRCGVSYGSSRVTNSYSWIHCRTVSRRTNVQLTQLVRNQRIELLDAGAKIAKSLIAKYQGILTKEAYVAEAVRIEELFKTEASAAVAVSIYRERTAQQLGLLNDE